MAVDSRNPEDALLPWLRSIHKALEIQNSKELDMLITNCISTFKSDPQYRDDLRFLKIWFLYMDGNSDYESVFREMEEHRICIRKALLYESFALFLEVKGRLIDACTIYHLGISRNAEPLARLKKAQVLFLERMSERVTNCSFQKAGLGGLSFDEGQFSVFGYTTIRRDLQSWSKAKIASLCQTKVKTAYSLFFR